jgi:isoleucyl-tRNA synthetase
VESYRRIRNTLRFLLANISDFDPAKDSVPVEGWLEIDRYALAMTREMADTCTKAYSVYEFHLVMQRLQTFCSEDLGAFYLDVLKDRLYTSQEKGLPRRSAQSALYAITQVLLRLMAPVMSFTAEEAWAVLHATTHPTAPSSNTIFTHTWVDVLPKQANESALIGKWSRIREIAAEVKAQLEPLRTNKLIGSSLQAEVVICANPSDYALLQALGDDLRFIVITSSAVIAQGAADSAISVTAAASEHAKCERCWHYRSDVGADPAHPHICGRCVSNLHGEGEARAIA